MGATACWVSASRSISVLRRLSAVLLLILRVGPQSSTRGIPRTLGYRTCPVSITLRDSRRPGIVNFEIRSTKSETNSKPKTQMTKNSLGDSASNPGIRGDALPFRSFGICHSNIVSDFDIRISDFVLSITSRNHAGLFRKPGSSRLRPRPGRSR